MGRFKLRLDKFLHVTKLIKRRTAATEAIIEGFVLINGQSLKPSYHVKVNDLIEIKTDIFSKKAKVTALPDNGKPNVKNIKAANEYIKIIDD
jgi:ribosomal 50S subunit-recycling heat shock protein